jgi:hypothetical protein
MRELITLRNQARSELHMFLFGVQSWLRETKEFLDYRESLEREYAKSAEIRRTTYKRPKKKQKVRSGTVSVSVPLPNTAADPVPDLSILNNHFFDLLRQAAQRQPPNEKQLEALGMALNQPVTVYRYSPTSEQPYGRMVLSGARANAEHLERYLNLIVRCSPVHGLCGQCGSMFIQGKGSRKFCPECSKKRQTYQGRKDYLRQKRQEYYRRDKADSHFSKERLK